MLHRMKEEDPLYLQIVLLLFNDQTLTRLMHCIGMHRQALANIQDNIELPIVHHILQYKVQSDRFGPSLQLYQVYYLH